MTLENKRMVFYPQHFNSHAHVERDMNLQDAQNAGYISTHTLTWSVTWTYRTHKTQAIFQLTRSRGAWRRMGDWAHEIKSFQLTRSRGAWPDCISQKIFIHKFQLTRSRGAWLCRFCYLLYLDYFNSHAHVERDMLKWESDLLAIISTHTLTWSVTWNC